MDKKITSRWKNNKSISLVAACALPLCMYVLAVPTPVFRYIIPAFIILVVLIEVLTWRRLADDREGRGWIIARSVLFYSAWLAVFFLMPSSGLQLAFMLISAPVLFMAQQLVAFGGETVLITHTSLTAFGLLLMAASAEYYFHAGSVVLTAIVFVLLLILSRATFVFVPQTPQVRLVASLLVALLATQGYAAILFLPFHYSVLGFLSFLSFYLIWLMTYYWQYNVLTKQKIKFYGLFALILAAAVLLATPWRIMQ
jgi:hypothetical protein